MSVPEVMALVSTISFVAAAYYTIKLGRESKGEDYWILLLVVVLAFGVMHFAAKIPAGRNLASEKTLALLIETAEIIGEITLAYLAYRLYTAMKTIRQTMQQR